MVKPFPSKTHIGNHELHPETLMLSYGYDPQLSEGAVKPPVFLTSTFVFKTAEDGRDFFDFVSGRREPPRGSAAGLVYSRFNHPNSEIVEDRLAVYERGRGLCPVLVRHVGDRHHPAAFARPGDVIVHSQPLYGGTETLLAKTLASFSASARWASPTVSTRPPSSRPATKPAQGPRIGHPHRNAVQPDQLPRRYRDGPPHRRRDRRGAGPAADRRVRQYVARAGVSAAARTWRRCLGLLPDQICRRPFRPDRRRGARLKGRSPNRSRRSGERSARSSIRTPAGCSAARWKR